MRHRLKLSLLLENRFLQTFIFSVASQFVEGYMMIIMAMMLGLSMHLSPRSWSNGASAAYVSSSVLWQAVLFAVVVFIVIQTRQSELVPFIYLQY